MPEGDTIHHAAKRVRGALVGTGDRVDRDPAPAPPLRSLARAARGPRRGIRRRPRQAPVPSLRGRPHAALPPAHGREVGRLPQRRALAAIAPPRLAGDPHGRPRCGAVRRPGARADDRVAHPLRPPPRRAGAGHRGRGLRRAGVPAPAARGRPHARDRRRPARPAHAGRHREPVEVRGVLLRRDRSVAADRRGRRRRGAGDRARGAPADARRRRRATATTGPPGSTSARACPCRRCDTLIRSRGQGDDNRTTFWCPACQA